MPSGSADSVLLASAHHTYSLGFDRLEVDDRERRLPLEPERVLEIAVEVPRRAGAGDRQGRRPGPLPTRGRWTTTTSRPSRAPSPRRWRACSGRSVTSPVPTSGPTEISAGKDDAGSFADAGLVDADADALTVDCDLLVPAALEGAVDADVAGGVDARIVVEGANAPCTPDALGVLRDCDVLVVPDVLANAGGVTASFYDWSVAMGRHDGADLDQAFVDDVGRANDDVWEAAGRDGVGLRSADASIGLGRVR